MVCEGLWSVTARAQGRVGAVCVCGEAGWCVRACGQ